LPFAACSVVMPLAQETKNEIEITAIIDNTILLVMVKGIYGFKIRNNKIYFGVKVWSEVL
jgi:hypothetical protein